MLKKDNKIGKTIAILRTILTIFLIFILLIVLVQKTTKNNLAIGGIRIFTVVSESMVPKYKIGDILILKEKEGKDIVIGDDVTYLGTAGNFAGLIVTHEVVDKFEESGKYKFITRGLANEIDDPEISEDDIYGTVVYKTVFLSFVSRLMTHTIIYYGLFVVVGVMISYQIITGYFNKDEEIEEGTNE